MVEEIRPLREGEYDSYFNMAAQAFRASAARARRSRYWTGLEELRGLFVDGQLVAGLKMPEPPIWMGPAPVPNAAVTGVASPPEYRRQGYIGRLLHGMLEELRDKGVPVSTLFPFAFPFYKRFGWEHVCDQLYYKIPIERLPFSAVGGTWHAIRRSTDFDKETPAPTSGEDLEVLMGIYDAWCVGRSGPLVRDENWWKRGKLQEGAEQLPDVYFWRDPSGRPGAYLIYSFEEIPNAWKRHLIVWELTAIDGPALRACMGFLRNHDSQATEVHVGLPADLHVLALLDDPEFHVELEANFMLRLVDVAPALAAKRYPRTAAARLALEVTDPFCDWNNGTYVLSVSEGIGVAERAPSATPGLRMDQKTLARLYTGYMSAHQAASHGLLEVLDPAALSVAQEVFAGPVPYMPDHF
jgi:predicted acetyltransferase